MAAKIYAGLGAGHQERNDYKMQLIKTFLLVLVFTWIAVSSAYAVTITDDAGQNLDFTRPPQRVVSLLPSASEIIAALGAAENIVGVTYHDVDFPQLAGKPIVGGAFTPRFDIINALKPDLLIVAPRDFAKAQAGRGDSPYAILVFDDGASLGEAEERIRLLGQVFQQMVAAEQVIAESHELMLTVAAKVNLIPQNERLKVMRLLLTDNGLLTPGFDSFQTEMIEAAGGITGDFGNGAFVPVALEQWREFNPDVVFGCGDKYAELIAYLQQEGWRDAPAVENNRIHNFPCALTCRAAAHTGYFTAWLASMIYTDHFCDDTKLAYKEEVLGERALDLDVAYVENARIVESRIMDFIHRTLLIDFSAPQTIVSTTAGQRANINTIGNSFLPVPMWSVNHKIGGQRSVARVFKILNLDRNNAELLFTGADMNNLAVKTATYQDITVTALVTAGVEGNAVHTAKDEGRWYETPGTINIIVMTNCKLTPGAASRALITITEAKTTALWDMDIRSVQTPLTNPATGTGTDDIIVVCGNEGMEITSTSQHSKMGQLISEAVYATVQEALLKQNGKLPQRNVFERLSERGLSPHGLMGGSDCPCQDNPGVFQAELEALLLEPQYASFVETAFSLNDARIMGHVQDISGFEAWCLVIASEIAGKPVLKIENIIGRDDLPPELAWALNALGTGAKYRLGME